MPIIKSAIKRVKQQAKAQVRNRSEKRSFRVAAKAFSAAVESKKSEEISKTLRDLQSQIDKLVKKNIIHKNNAARKKASFSAQAKAAGAKVAKAAPKKTTTKKTVTKKATAAKKPVAKKAS